MNIFSTMKNYLKIEKAFLAIVRMGKLGCFEMIKTAAFWMIRLIMKSIQKFGIWQYCSNFIKGVMKGIEKSSH